MPSSAFIYFSATGNTKLSSEYLVHRIPQVDFSLIDLREFQGQDLSSYDVIGLATYVDFQGPPKLMMDAIDSLPPGGGKPVFIICTYAGIPGQTLKTMKRLLEAKGYRVISGHALRMPENYSPMRKKGMKGDERPGPKDLEGFQTYIRGLGDAILTYHLKGELSQQKIKIGFVNSFFKGRDRYKAKKEMGVKKLDEALCTRCGVCARSCPYDAIRLSPRPVFDEGRCMGCFSCYNRCPVGAISTEKLTNEFRYPGPSEGLKKRMSY
ncbi:MAG: EFR1 family ferrodoxin [Thermoplasmatota archaeon]